MYINSTKPSMYTCLAFSLPAFSLGNLLIIVSASTAITLLYAVAGKSGGLTQVVLTPSE